jgi:Putative auto-transporter adhesin, head GIN domain
MRTILSAVPFIMLAACGHAVGNSTSQAHGTRAFPLTGFDQVALKGSDDVRVVSGPAFSVVASGPEAVLEQLDIHLDGDTLNVSRKKSGWSMRWGRHDDKGAVITVTMPSIRGAALAGSGDMSVDRVEGDAFKASLAGSGNLNIGAAKTGALDINLAGSGDIALGGTATSAKVSLAGSGNVTAPGLTVVSADVSLAGSGDVSLRATGDASVSIIGSGDVTIAGTDKCKISKLGSGDVHCTI